jgi:hypothetical protein
MKLVDVNILLYSINEDSPYHGPINEWWKSANDSGERIGLTWLVVIGFLRISTSPRVMPQPLDADAALRTIKKWLNLDNIGIVSESENHWELLQTLVEENGILGDLMTDAHLAALAKSHGATVVSCDKDFSKFNGLRWENPLNGSLVDKIERP